MLNEVRFIGFATKDAETFTHNGKNFSVTGLAVDNSYENKDGQRVEDVLFIDLYFFNGYAEVAKKHIQKGKKLFIGGSLKMKPYTTKNGDKAMKSYVVVENIEFLSPKNVTHTEAQSSNASVNNAPKQPSPKEDVNNIPPINHEDDEIPF